MTENEEQLKSLLMKVKEESEKVGLKLSIKKRRSWHLIPSLHSKQMRKKWKQWQTLLSSVPKSLWMVTEATKLKDTWLLGRKAMTNLESILKSRDIILLTKVHIVKDTVFLVVMYRCESWTIKKAESPRIDAFELWC